MAGGIGGHGRGRPRDLRFHHDDHRRVRAFGVHPGACRGVLRALRAHGELRPDSVAVRRAHRRPRARRLPASPGRPARRSGRGGRHLRPRDVDAAPVHADHPVDAPAQGDYFSDRVRADYREHGPGGLHSRHAVSERRRSTCADRALPAARHSSRPDTCRGGRNRGKGEQRRRGVQHHDRSVERVVRRSAGWAESGRHPGESVR